MYNIFAFADPEEGRNIETTNYFKLMTMGKDQFNDKKILTSTANRVNKEIKACHAQYRQLGYSQPVGSQTQTLLSSFPKGSFFVGFAMTLSSVWHSKDDDPFYPIENPVRKNLVFKIPEMSAKTWKGYFRSAGMGMGNGADPDRINQLFGQESADAENSVQGKVFFYPTVFNAIDYYNLNPHDRSIRKGKDPVTLEVAPRGAKGYFTLFYRADYSNTPLQKKKDMKMICHCLGHVFQESGFSAKRGIGFGRAVINRSRKNENKLQLHSEKKGVFESCITGFDMIYPMLEKGFCNEPE